MIRYLFVVFFSLKRQLLINREGTTRLILSHVQTINWLTDIQRVFSLRLRNIGISISSTIWSRGPKNLHDSCRVILIIVFYICLFGSWIACGNFPLANIPGNYSRTLQNAIHFFWIHFISFIYCKVAEEIWV